MNTEQEKQKQAVKFHRPERIKQYLEIIKLVAWIIFLLLSGGLVLRAIISGVWFN